MKTFLSRVSEATFNTIVSVGIVTGVWFLVCAYIVKSQLRFLSNSKDPLPIVTDWEVDDEVSTLHLDRVAQVLGHDVFPGSKDESLGRLDLGNDSRLACDHPRGDGRLDRAA